MGGIRATNGVEAVRRACQNVHMTSERQGAEAGGPEEPVELPVDGVLDLHMFRPAEVREAVLCHIEACRTRGIRDLRLIHGKGIGTLREQVHALLRRHPAVASFRIAGEDAGGWGATLVRLAERA